MEEIDMALGITGAYDRAITVFSPQGRLYQVEYALETVRSGSTALAIVCNEGVVLAAEEILHTKLQNPNFSWKIFQIDKHIGAATSGLNSDARVLVDNARIQAQVIRLSYDEDPAVEAITKHIGDIAQMYTQHAGVRPFGAGLLIGGVDKKGPSLFLVDPSGMYLEYLAWAIGRGAEKVREYLEKKYSKEISLEEAIQLAISSLVYATEKIEEEWTVRVAYIPVKTKTYTLMPQEEIKKYLEKAFEEKKTLTK